MHRALCLTAPKMRCKSVDNLGHTGQQAATGAHGPPAKFLGGGGVPAQKVTRTGAPAHNFLFF